MELSNAIQPSRPGSRRSRPIFARQRRLYHGANLPDPAELLEGSGKRMRHVKLRPEVPFDESALEALISAAYRDISQGDY